MLHKKISRRVDSIRRNYALLFTT